MLIKATKVDGVYDSDPKKNADAKKFDELTYIDTINRRLEVMDLGALKAAAATGRIGNTAS